MHRSLFRLRALFVVSCLYSCAAFAAGPPPKNIRKEADSTTTRPNAPKPFSDPNEGKEQTAPLGGPVVPLNSDSVSSEVSGRTPKTISPGDSPKTTVTSNASTRPTPDNRPSEGQPFVPGVTYSGATAEAVPGSAQAPAALGPAPYDLGSIRKVVVAGQPIAEAPLRVGNLDVLVPMTEQLSLLGAKVTKVDPKLTPGGLQGQTAEQYFQLNPPASPPVVCTVGRSNAWIDAEDTPLRCAPLIIQGKIWLPVFSIAPLVSAAARLDTDGTLYLTPTVESVELFQVQNALALTITTSAPIPEDGFKINSLSGPDRLYIDFPGYSMGFDAGNSTFERVVSVGRGTVQRVRAGMPSKFPDVTRVTLDLKQPMLAIVQRMPQENLYALVLVNTDEPIRPPGPHATPTPTPTGPPVRTTSFGLGGMKIVIDAGHGGHDTGARGTASQEKDHTLDIARRVAGHLRARGAQVLMTRDTDIFISLQGRATFANTRNADMFVSVHINAAVNKATQGTETYYYTAHSLPLAREIHKEFLAATGRPNRGVRSARFYVIRKTSMPSVLLETAFISNSKEEQLLRSPEWRENVARGITRGILNYADKYVGRGLSG